MASTITLKFNNTPLLQDGQKIQLKLGVVETFKTSRTAQFEVPISTSIINTAGNIINFLKSFNIDYNNTGDYFIIQSGLNELRITNINDNWFNGSNIINTTNGAVEIVSIYNNNQPTDFSITNVSYLESVNDKCNKVKVKVDTNIVADKIEQPIQQNVNINPFEFEFIRGVSANLIMSKGVELLYNLTGIITATCSQQMLGQIEVITPLTVINQSISILGNITGSIININNTNLAGGQELLLQPGVYQFSAPAVNCSIGNIGSTSIVVKNNNNYVNDSILINTPSKLSSNDFNLDIIFSLSGGNLNIIASNLLTGLNLQYSIDNINWQTTTVFTNLIEGNYTLYIKDQFNCVVQKQFTINNFSSREPLAYISKANSLSFIKSVSHDNFLNYKNDDNTFSFEKIGGLNMCGEQLFINKDKITTQLKSNYKNINVVLRNDNGINVNIALSKKSNNLGRYSKLDCFYYSYSSSETAIFFTSGNVYDINNNIISQFLLEGNLPDFAIIGNSIELDGIGLFEIKDFFYDENYNKNVIIIDYVFNGVITNSKVSSIYDLLNFDVYEFDIDFNIYGNGIYDVVVYNTDNNYNDVVFVSENIIVSDNHENTVAIVSYNNLENNSDIFYKYGIKHFARLPLNYFKKSPKTNSVISINDNNATRVKSNVYDVDEIGIDYVSKDIAFKFVLWVEMDNLFINNIGYLSDNEPSIEDKNNSNIYTCSCKLIKTNTNYNNNKFNYSGVDNSYEQLFIPSIISIDSTKLLKQ